MINKLSRQTAELVKSVFPTTWLDPLLTGDKAVVSNSSEPFSCQDIERLLDGIQERIQALVSEDEPRLTYLCDKCEVWGVKCDCTDKQIAKRMWQEYEAELLFDPNYDLCFEEWLDKEGE